MADIAVSPTIFKQFNRIMVPAWRLGLGRAINTWPKVTGRIMVVTTVGRKSGLFRRTPVNYAWADDALYCTAGFGKKTAWYRNLKANPWVEVWLPDGAWAARAEDVPQTDDTLPIYRQILINSGLAAWAFLGFDPATVSADVLRGYAANSPLVRLHLNGRLGGPAIPGDLSWIWPPLVGMALVGLACMVWRRKRRRDDGHLTSDPS